MSNERLPYIIGTIIAVILLIIIISLGFFDGWVFFGMVFYIALFIGGYFYIIIGWQKDKEAEMQEHQRKQKFEWCFRRINETLRKMPGGQGIEWDAGFGRVSDFKTFNDGVQNKPFRSVLGYLQGTQQLVIVIYDIDNDDIAKYNANPSPAEIADHFHNFDPFKRRSSGFGTGFSRYRRDRYGRPIRKSPSAISIHMNDGVGGDPDREDFDDLKTKPDSGTVDDAFKRLNK